MYITSKSIFFKHVWLAFVFGFTLMHATEHEYRNMMQGQFLRFDDQNIWIYYLKWQPKNNVLTVDIQNVLENHIYHSITFQTSNIYAPLNHENMNFSLRKNGNLYIHNDENDLKTVLYKLDEKCTQENMLQLQHLVSELKNLEPKVSSKSFLMSKIPPIFPNVWQKMNTEDFQNPTYLPENSDYKSTALSNITPVYLPENSEYKFKGLINWACGFCVIAIICLAYCCCQLNPEDQQGNNDQQSRRFTHSPSPNFSHHKQVITICPDNKIQSIEVRKIYLNNSPSPPNYSLLSRCSTYHLGTTKYELMIQHHFRSTDTETKQEKEDDDDESIPEVLPWLSNSHNIQTVSYRKIMHQHFRTTSS